MSSVIHDHKHIDNTVFVITGLLEMTSGRRERKRE
jgi:hypothetical protein